MIADADNGYGGPLNVVAPCSFMSARAWQRCISKIRCCRSAAATSPANSWFPPQDMVAKIKAATDARTDEDFVLSLAPMRWRSRAGSRVRAGRVTAKPAPTSSSSNPGWSTEGDTGAPQVSAALQHGDERQDAVSQIRDRGARLQAHHLSQLADARRDPCRRWCSPRCARKKQSPASRQTFRGSRTFLILSECRRCANSRSVMASPKRRGRDTRQYCIARGLPGLGGRILTR